MRLRFASFIAATVPAWMLLPLLLACGQTESAVAYHTSLYSSNASFGLNITTDFFVVNTGAGLVFSVRRHNTSSSTHSPGDIQSLVIDGIEYQSSLKGSQVNSGFDWLYTNTTNVTVAAMQPDTDTIKITVQAAYLTHYYMARRGQRHIYLATYFDLEPTVVPQVRYIFRIQYDKLPYGPPESDLTHTVKVIEAQDIYALANGETRSKHYSNHRAIDWYYIGGYSHRVGLWVVRDGYQGASGGPFYRCLLNKRTNTTNEVTYMINYNEAQTGPFRTRVLNHYTLVVTNGSQPARDIDTSWFANMSLIGYVASSGRGSVRGVRVQGRDSRFPYYVGLNGTRAQYWGDLFSSDDAGVVSAGLRASSSGEFRVEGVLPGLYNLTVFKNELAVYTVMVNISAGATTTLADIDVSTRDPSYDRVLWRLGHWDGTPQEFLNGDRINHMHPSDVRMESWRTPTWVVGGPNSTSSSFPCYLWQDVNNFQNISFNLSAAMQQMPHRLRIGITVAYAHARPQISINGWVSPVPDPSVQPPTRSLTVGTYRGNNHIFSFDVPASVWKKDSISNLLSIGVASGSGGTQFLSPGFSLDCIDLLE